MEPILYIVGVVIAFVIYILFVRFIFRIPHLENELIKTNKLLSTIAEKQGVDKNEIDTILNQKPS
jgi:hypothetical protein